MPTTPRRPSDVLQDDPGVEVWSMFLRAHAAVVRTLELEVEEATGLPLAWYDVLLELNAAEGRRLRMQDLAALVVLSRSRVSRVVDEIRRAGMVDKVPDPTDGRATFAVLTDAGRRALRRAAPVYLASIEQHFSRHLTTAQLRALRDGLAVVLDAHEPT